MFAVSNQLLMRPSRVLRPCRRPREPLGSHSWALTRRVQRRGAGDESGFHIPTPAGRVRRQRDQRPQILDRQSLRRISDVHPLLGVGTPRRERSHTQNHHRGDCNDAHDPRTMSPVFPCNNRRSAGQIVTGTHLSGSRSRRTNAQVSSLPRICLTRAGSWRGAAVRRRTAPRPLLARLLRRARLAAARTALGHLQIRASTDAGCVMAARESSS